eukprot:167545-Alexandrium_andersonii.AAC.1
MCIRDRSYSSPSVGWNNAARGVAEHVLATRARWFPDRGKEAGLLAEFSGRTFHVGAFSEELARRGRP